MSVGLVDLLALTYVSRLQVFIRLHRAVVGTESGAKEQWPGSSKSAFFAESAS